MAARNRRTPNQKERDAMRGAALMRRLNDFAMDTEDTPKHRMSSKQVQAAQIALKKLIPDLSSVEQTIVDERDAMTEEQILDQLKTVIASSPDIASKLSEMLVQKARQPA